MKYHRYSTEIVVWSISGLSEVVFSIYDFIKGCVKDIDRSPNASLFHFGGRIVFNTIVFMEWLKPLVDQSGDPHITQM